MGQSIRTRINGRVYEYNGADDLAALFAGDVAEATRAALGATYAVPYTPAYLDPEAEAAEAEDARYAACPYGDHDCADGYTACIGCQRDHEADAWEDRLSDTVAGVWL